MSQRNSARGFSLVELGIVIAVMAVLVGVVIGGMGFANAAKRSKALDQVLTLRKAAREYAMRHQNGLSYGVSTAQNDPANVTLKALMSEQFINGRVTTPWGDSNILVGPNGAAAPACAGFACVEIRMPVPAEECTDGFLVANLQDKAIIPPTCIGTTLTVIMR